MERFTISLDEELARQFDQLIAERQRQQPEGHCVANLSYVYNHHERDLAERLTHLQHEHHDLTVASLHSHLDHENCIESVILKGPSAQVQRFANALIAESGVRHGQLNVVALEATPDQAHSHAHSHSHPQGGHGQPHTHYRPAR